MKAKRGNVGKRDAYALAFEMIDEAIEAHCPLQAIAIEESVLSDRLWSTLNVGRDRVSDSDLKKQGLGSALIQLKNAVDGKETSCRLFDDELKCQYKNLDDWRQMRNKLLHSIARSRQGEEPSIPAGEFREYAQYAAKVGLRLVRTVLNWSQKSINRKNTSK